MKVKNSDSFYEESNNFLHKRFYQIWGLFAFAAVGGLYFYQYSLENGNEEESNSDSMVELVETYKDIAVIAAHSMTLFPLLGMPFVLARNNPNNNLALSQSACIFVSSVEGVLSDLQAEEISKLDQRVIKSPEFERQDTCENTGACGTENQVNTYTSSDQLMPSVATLRDGKFVAVWASYGQQYSYYGVYGQIYTPDGKKYGGEFRVSDLTSDSDLFVTSQAVTGLADGKFVVVWHGNGSSKDIYAKIYNSDGTVFKEKFRVNTFASNNQQNPVVIGLSDGRFAISWTSYSQSVSSGYDIYAQIYDKMAVTVGKEFMLSSGGIQSTEIHPSIASFDGGKFAVSWAANNNDDKRWNIFCKLFYSNGKILKTLQVNQNDTVAAQDFPSISRISSDRFCVAWRSRGAEASGIFISGRIYSLESSDSAEAVTNEFVIANSTALGSDDVTAPYVSEIDDNEFGVLWVANDQDKAGVFGRLIDLSGKTVKTPFQVSTYYKGDQGQPVLTRVAKNGVLALWSSYQQDGSGYGIFAQRFNQKGSRTEIDVPISLNSSITTTTDDGGRSSDEYQTINNYYQDGWESLATLIILCFLSSGFGLYAFSIRCCKGTHQPPMNQFLRSHEKCSGDQTGESLEDSMLCNP